MCFIHSSVAVVNTSGFVFKRVITCTQVDTFCDTPCTWQCHQRSHSLGQGHKMVNVSLLQVFYPIKMHSKLNTTCLHNVTGKVGSLSTDSQTDGQTNHNVLPNPPICGHEISLQGSIWPCSMGLEPRKFDPKILAEISKFSKRRYISTKNE